MLGLTCISLVLLTARGAYDGMYYIKLFGVAILWCIFLLSFTPLQSFAQIKVLSARADKLIILSLLVIIFLLLLAIFLNAIRNLRLGVALLLGIFIATLWEIITDFAARAPKDDK